jgi:hypothetical protein
MAVNIGVHLEIGKELISSDAISFPINFLFHGADFEIETEIVKLNIYIEIIIRISHGIVRKLNWKFSMRFFC